MFNHIPSRLIMEMRRPQNSEGIFCLLWFSERNVDNLGSLERQIFQNLEYLVAFRSNFHRSLHTGCSEKIKKKGTFYFRHWGKVFVSPLPRDLVELQGWMRNEFSAVKRDIFVRVWTKIKYRQDVCRATKGAHIEYL
ncbi:uncharacterized protein TNCV_2529101 [Trichonephila clavipes]|nr:uncharacterized protein TNCV_2529101 [Trichonephila clavipes]